jgi:hypothetical protein
MAIDMRTNLRRNRLQKKEEIKAQIKREANNPSETEAAEAKNGQMSLLSELIGPTRNQRNHQVTGHRKLLSNRYYCYMRDILILAIRK